MSQQVDQQEYVDATDDELPQSEAASINNKAVGRKQKSLARQQKATREEEYESDEYSPPPRISTRGGRRIVPVHQSRIKDRPAKVGEKDSSLKIKIELDLEVEVELYARVKGDVTIGLL
ncbi:hypothetical protein QBC47DRAFT_388937 [Echria macrotheca]|uniref:Uncharacterized protein n=1 Tax=Echria macrotheca TaxID=438768 RepID=A0AAJ0F3S5_9PEZI|nr:hypothetical protein QBC47DRAFT_388937 [Echria macrotheca]